MVALIKLDNRILNTIIQGDCIEVMQTLDDCSIDSIVTDPPAGISFMGKDWDNFSSKTKKDSTARRDANNRGPGGGNGNQPFSYSPDSGRTKKERDAFISFLTEVMAECLRVLKPGGYGLIWSLPRTSHWTATAIEDAGFEIRDVVTHIQGQGFPKSLNLGNGQGTALKPSVEMWILARKPISEKSIAENVLRWNGCGALNIEQCRVAAPDHPGNHNAGGNGQGIYNWNKETVKAGPIDRTPQGRFPANLLLSHSVWCIPIGTKRVRANGPSPDATGNKSSDIYQLGLKTNSPISYRDADGMETIEAWECHASCPIAELDRQSGVRKSNARANCEGKLYTTHNKEIYSAYNREKPLPMYYDQGGASRYFSQFSPDVPVPFTYCSKASKRDRSSNGTVDNIHPTCKPQQLMRYLIRLCTPPGGIVLDCFAGSGSTLVAAIHEGVHFIGIEQDEAYCAIAESRIAHAYEEVREQSCQ